MPRGKVVAQGRRHRSARRVLLRFARTRRRVSPVEEDDRPPAEQADLDEASAEIGPLLCKSYRGSPTIMPLIEPVYGDDIFQEEFAGLLACRDHAFDPFFLDQGPNGRVKGSHAVATVYCILIGGD